MSKKLNECLGDLLGKLPNDTLRKEYADLSEQLEQRLNRYVQKTNDVNDVRRLADRIINEELEYAVNKQIRNVKQNIAETKLKHRLSVAENSGVAQPDAYFDTLIGGKGLYEGSKSSVALEQLAQKAELIDGFYSDLEKVGLRKYVENTKSGIFTKNTQGELTQKGMARAMRDINDQAKLDELLKAGKISKEDIEFAKIVQKWQNIAIDRQNALGAYIKPRWDYLTKQSHSMTKIRNVPFLEGWTVGQRKQIVDKSKEEWVKEISNRLDMKETFGDMEPEEIAKILDDAADDLAYGRHYNRGFDTNINILGQRQPLAEKISAERVFIFKSADDWFEYNAKYGVGDLMDSILLGLRNAGDNIGLMKVLGPDPIQTHAKMMANLSATNPEYMRGYRGRRLQAAFNQVSGQASIPSDASLAKIGSSIRAWNILAKLGNAMISSITDVGFFAHELQYQGVGLISSYAKALSATLATLPGKERKAFARSLGVGIDGMMGDIMSRFSHAGIEDVPGALSKAVQRFFKLNLQEQWTDGMKSASGMMMANRLAELKVFDWKTLGANETRLRKMLSAYGIDETKWNIMREVNSKGVFNDMDYLTPDGILALSDDVIRKHAAVDLNLGRLRDEASVKKVIDNYRQDLANDLRMYFIDRANMAIPTSGARQRITTRASGAEPGTVWGEVESFFWQFKSFPLAVAQNVLGVFDFGRSAGSSFLKDKGIGMYGSLLTSLFVLGYISSTLKDITKGVKPLGWDYMTGDQPITNMSYKEVSKIFMNSMLQGGGLGLYGDFLFASQTRFGQSAAESFAGPTLGAIGGAANTLVNIRELLEKGDAPDSAFRNLASKFIFGGVKSNIPLINLFYVNSALNYGMWYSLQEAMNPGALRRMEKRRREEEQKEFIWSPSRGEAPWGRRLKPFE